jgi:hypothetical protein
MAALISFYNDKKGLERLITSMQPGEFDLIVTVDGKYPHYGEENIDTPLSNDGSREYLQKLAASYKKTKEGPSVVLLNKPDYEFRKRQAYLDYLHARNFRGYGLVIDTDEYIDNKLTEFDKFYEEITQMCEKRQENRGWNIFNVELAMNDPGYVDTMRRLYPDMQQTDSSNLARWQWMPRLWRNPGDMAYFLNHYNFRRRDPSHPYHAALYEPPRADVKGLWIRHDHTLRSAAEIDKRVKYQKWLMDFEQNIIPWYYRRYKTLPENLEECALVHAKFQEDYYQKYEPKRANPNRIIMLEKEVKKYATSSK